MAGLGKLVVKYTALSNAHDKKKRKLRKMWGTSFSYFSFSCW